MANVSYRKLPDGSYLQQVGNAGGPVAFRISGAFGATALSAYDAFWSPDGKDWFPMQMAAATAAAAQTNLDNYVTQLNGGTA